VVELLVKDWTRLSSLVAGAVASVSAAIFECRPSADDEVVNS
jgi:hypothetical protein